jgi:hypothetical protein
MKYVKTSLVLGLVMAVGAVWGQGRANIEPVEKHYQYLENEVKNTRETIQKESEAYRKFVQEERAQHQSFLEWCVKIGGGLLAFLGVALTFFGWNTFKGIDKSRKELANLAKEKLSKYGEALKETEGKLYDARQNMIELQTQYQQYINFYRDADPKNGRYLIIGSKENLDEMKKGELVRFRKVFGITEDIETTEAIKAGLLYLSSYQTIIYRTSVTDGEDKNLETIVDIIKSLKDVPFVIYAAKGDRLTNDGATFKKVYELELVHMATNLFTLIENVASAYRIAKMLPKT